VFRAAVEGYREQAERLLIAELTAIQQGRTPELRIILSRPRDHTRDYDRAIRMLEMDTRDELTLDERTFGQYVMDQWQWKSDFLRMSNSYAAGATEEAYGVIEDDDL
jgi:hypothetical protein